MSRRVARELALRALYAQEMSGNPIQGIVLEMIDSSREEDKDKEFARELFVHSAQKKKDLDSFIIKRTKNWDFERIAIIDKLVMRLAICEFLHFEDIPPKVSIDEAIEIVKKYSTENSGQFINGILDGVLQDLRNADLLKKKGRGLS
ncbi:MAG TPA: transcription antitermination factor NusB [bacterium]